MKYNVTQLYVFGSVLTDQFKESHLPRLKAEMEKLLGE